MINLESINLSGINLSGVDLSDIKLGSIRARRDPRPKGCVAAYSAKGKTNSDPDRAILKDLSGNGRDIQLKNFAWSGESGYKDGLVFDGVDDYGVCETMPIMTDYTICCIRKRFETKHRVTAVASKHTPWSPGVSGAFMLEYSNRSCYSFGQVLPSITFPQLFTAMSKYNYNGRPIVPLGTNVDSKILTLARGSLSASTVATEKMILYSFELYDRTLTPEELEAVKTRMLAEYYDHMFDPKSCEYQALWTANGKTNEDVDKKVPNLIDATNPMVPSNFAWNDESGYKDGLVFDGVDDLFSSVKALPALSKYTIVVDFSTTKAGTGVGKINQWFIYHSSVFINSGTIANQNTRVIGVNSSGLIVGAKTTIGKIGDINDTLSRVIQSAGTPKMTFRSLAIIPYELNEAQIRSVYEYLKTLKANNIG